MKSRKCDICGKEMLNDCGSDTIGLICSFSFPHYGEYTEKQLGGFKHGRTYECCIECYLKSFGFKPEGE